jgi:uncharacterized protein YbjT (DUF2867 family)
LLLVNFGSARHGRQETIRRFGSAMNDKVVTVFGGDGFVGRYAVQALLNCGARVRVVSRNPKRGWFLKSQANLGQIAYVAADITRPATITRAVEGADAVVNLVGVFGSTMDAVHVGGAKAIAEAASKAKVGALVHMSAIGADREGKSNYGRTKGEGEAAVLKAFPNATILRPSLVFGQEDQLTNRFAGLIRLLPIVPVIGGQTRFQPIYVGDVAQVVTAAVADSAKHGGKIYELGGPQILSMRELNEWIARAIGREKFFIDVPDLAAEALATLAGWLPAAPITRDQWLMLQKDNVVGEGAKGLEAFDMTPVSLDAVAPRWLIQFKRHGRFAAEVRAS